MCSGGYMDRGIQATAAGLEKSKSALKLKGWTQEYLAGVAGCTRQTVSRFLAGKRIEKRIFQDICNELDLKWVDIAELEVDDKRDRPPNIDELVETVRINIYDSIQTKCGSIRVLEMTQPIDLNAIYTTVNILEKITGRQRLEYQELMHNCSSENYERFSLSGVQESRIPALDAVNKCPKLIILGKPGAGKTTFLKYVALQCIEGNFKPNLIPLFITLKDFAEADKQPGLLVYIIQLFKRHSIDNGDTSTTLMLQQGRFAILLDGLDEVREVDSKRILWQIQDLSDCFSKNLFVITCRIAAKEYTFEKFTEVEVADFDDQQIATFTQQWFQSKNDPIKAENFIKKLKEEPGIRDLASSPILLTLLCLVFGESGSFPSNRSELYKEGLDVLLKKWDTKRNISRDVVYQKLSLKRKEDLLSQIAIDTFTEGKYFFKQKEAERYITQYIRNLPDASTAEDILRLDSEAVLKSIESQHGLFIERARGIYSFSHLTFHEYFAARKVAAHTNSDISIRNFAAYTTDKRWREVLILAVEMLENADILLEAMKLCIDSTLSQDKQLQKFLIWLDQKSYSIKSNYKLTAIRLYYLNLVLAVDHIPELALDLNLEVDLEVDLSLTHALRSDLVRTYTDSLNLSCDLTRTIEPIKLHRSIRHIQDKLLAIFSTNLDDFDMWWQTNNRIWTEQLREIAIEHRNIGHDWQFREAQEKLLRQYYDANKLLVECLNSDCYVSREVRESIESTLLLPISSIEKLKSS